MIMFGDTHINNLKHGTKDIKKVKHDAKNVWLRHDPTFRLTINSGTDRKFIIPISGGYQQWVSNKPYAWDIDWGDNSKGTFTGNYSQSKGITHTYPNADAEYVIRITPANGERGWLKNFGNYVNTGSADYNTPVNLDKVKKVEGKIGYYDMSYKDGDAAVASGLFRGFTSLTIGDDFVFFTDGDWFGDEFLRTAFMNTGITKLSKQLSLKHIVNASVANTKSFASTFASCKKLVSAEPEFELPNLTGKHNYMFDSFLYASPIELSGSNVKVPTGLIGGDVIFYYFNGSGTTKGGIVNFFNNVEWDKSNMSSLTFMGAFENNPNITDVLSVATIPMMKVTNYSNRCFFNCNNTQNVPAQWK